MSEITLIDYTGNGMNMGASRFAAAKLVFTKSTRLNMLPGLFGDMLYNWPWEKLQEELEAMARTIPSSWEMIDYTFLVTNATRGFTHQVVRSRHMSFAQQTMRILDMSQGNGWTYGKGPTIEPESANEHVYDGIMQFIADAYKDLIEHGVALEDARGILPTAIHTNIICHCNMRTLVELGRKRVSPRVQAEYRQYVADIQSAALSVHPWLDLFINRRKDVVMKELSDRVEKIRKYFDLEDPIPIEADSFVHVQKLIDELRVME